MHLHCLLQCRWANQWAQLVADLTKNSNTAEHLLVDVLNEPDNYGIKWEASEGKAGRGKHLSVADVEML